MSPSALTSSELSPVPVANTNIKETNYQLLQPPSQHKSKREQVPFQQGANPEHVSFQNDTSAPLPEKALTLYPHLTCQVNLYDDQLVFSQDGRDIGFQISPESAMGLQTLCMLMDGSHSLAQLQRLCAPDHPETIRTLVEHLDQQGFICTNASQFLASEDNVASTLHGVTHRWMNEGLAQQALQTNRLWQEESQRIVPDLIEEGRHPGNLSQLLTRTLLQGWGIESYHLFSQLQWSCSSLLSYAGPAQTQAFIKALYATLQNYLQHLTTVLETIGIGTKDSLRTLPLASTMTMVNGLTFWANTEPLFCISCLGFALDRMVANVEGYVAALDASRVASQSPNSSTTDASTIDAWLTNDAVVIAMRSLIHNQRSHSPLSLVHEIFEAAHFDHNARVRMHNQSHLLADMLCNFYVGIDQHYGSDGHEPQSLSILRKPGQKLGFKDGVLLTFKNSKIELRYQNQGFAIAVSDDGQQSLGYALKLLQMGGISPEHLGHACPDLQEHLPDILAECDRQGLLQKHKELADRFGVRTDGCSGAQFYQDLLRFLTWLKQQFPPSPLSQQMADGTISRDQLIGYALESYHVTALCPRLLAPALAHPESSTTQLLLRDFFVSELHHDRLMEKSLMSVGIPTHHLQHIQPLPTTFSVCSALGVFARQHPLSFKSALMLFEEDDHHFHDLFEQCCKSLGLPSEFYRPILLHAQINDEGEHDKITATLLSEISYISPTDQLLVKKNMALLMETMVLRTQEILHYYGHATPVLPRIFSA